MPGDEAEAWFGEEEIEVWSDITLDGLEDVRRHGDIDFRSCCDTMTSTVSRTTVSLLKSESTLLSLSVVSPLSVSSSLCLDMGEDDEGEGEGEDEKVTEPLVVDVAILAGEQDSNLELIFVDAVDGSLICDNGFEESSTWSVISENPYMSI